MAKKKDASGFTLAEMQAAIAEKQACAEALLARKAELTAELATIDEQLVAEGIIDVDGAAPAKRRGRKPGRKPGRKAGRKAGRPKGSKGKAADGTLVQTLQSVLAKHPKGMRVSDILPAVKAAGYKSDAKNFYAMVAASLRDKKLFQRLSRGVYTTK